MDEKPPHTSGPTEVLHSEAPVSRRRFLVVLLGTTGILGLAGLVAPIVRFAFPTAKGEIATTLKVSTMAELTAAGGELDIEYSETPSSLVLQADGTVVGLSRICTHLGCIIKWEGDNDRFFCPCHAGIFSPTGVVLGGPPPRPLPKMKIAVKGTDIWVEGWEA